MNNMEEPEDIKKHSGNTKWLGAHYDPVAQLYTFSQCMCLSDISAEGDNKLIIADLGTGTYDMKLKVFKGTTLVQENTIIDLPTGVVSFYMDTTEPRTPAIAVASGPYIYVYKNLRPYFKFTLPTLDINPVEQDLWNQAKTDQIDIVMLREMLDNIRNEGGQLTVRSLKFLQLPEHDLHAFYASHKEAPLKKQTVITSLATLKKSHPEDDAISCLVLGTENCNIYILDPEAFTVLTTIDLNSVPVFLSVSGLYDVEYRIIVACRNGAIYMLKRETKIIRPVFELNSQPVGLERLGKSIIVGCMDETLQCYTSKGKKLWSHKLPASITTVEIMDHRQRGFKAILVGLANCEVHIYRDKFLVNTIRTEDIVTGMKFGRFGREDGALIMTTKAGGMIVKILKRTASFEEKDSSGGPPVSQSQKLNVPKKTKLFVDQTVRERESCVTMHRQFQHDLYMLRVETARNYLKSLENSMNPISIDASEPVKLSAQVQGIGPTFKLTVTLQNTSMSIPTMNWFITFQYDHNLYHVERKLIKVPIMVPGLNYSFETFVKCLNDKGISDTVKVFVLKEGKNIPVITAVINMPVSEALVVV